MDERAPSGEFNAAEITRPDAALLRYYLVISLLTGPAFPFVFIPHWFKYITLRYAFDDDGVSMSWGVLFRREILLTYRRIQDIHVRRNLIHRWIGLATLSLQTASGASGAEMAIEGVLEPERLRDFLYARMRGAKDEDDDADAPDSGASPDDEALALLGEIRGALADLRPALERLAQKDAS
ncbi:MAG: PH domain-containing protein [Phycisphaerales bacterium]